MEIKEKDIYEFLSSIGYNRATKEQIEEFIEKNLRSSLDLELIEGFSIKNDFPPIFVVNENRMAFGFSIKNVAKGKKVISNLGNWYLETEIDESIIEDYKKAITSLSKKFGIEISFTYTGLQEDKSFEVKLSVFIVNLKQFSSFSNYVEEFRKHKHRWTNPLLKEYENVKVDFGVCDIPTLEYMMKNNKAYFSNSKLLSPFRSSIMGVTEDFLYLGEKGKLNKLVISSNEGDVFGTVVMYQTKKGIIFGIDITITKKILLL